MFKLFNRKNQNKHSDVQKEQLHSLQELPDPAILKVIKHLDVHQLGALKTTSKFFSERLSDHFIARRCLEVRHKSLHCPIELLRKNGRSYVYFFDETEEETQAIDRLGIRPSFSGPKS